MLCFKRQCVWVWLVHIEFCVCQRVSSMDIVHDVRVGSLEWSTTACSDIVSAVDEDLGTVLVSNQINWAGIGLQATHNLTRWQILTTTFVLFWSEQFRGYMSFNSYQQFKICWNTTTDAEILQLSTTHRPMGQARVHHNCNSILLTILWAKIILSTTPAQIISWNLY